MPITPEEGQSIIEAINSGKSITEIEALQPIADKVVVHTTDGFNKFKENLINSELDKKIGGRVKEIYDGIDADLDAIGFAKIGPEEKTFDRIKRLGGEFKNSKTKYDQERAELLAKIEANEGVDVIKAEFDQKQSAWSNKENEYKSTITDLQRNMVNYRKTSIIDSELAQYQGKFKDGLPEALVKTHLDNVRNTIANRTQLSEDGKSLVVLDETGRPRTNPATYEPITLSQEVKALLGDVIQEGRVQKGAGGQGGDPKDPMPKDDKGQIKIEELQIPEEIKTQVALDEYLQKTLELKGEDFFKASQMHGRDKGLPIY